MAPVDSGDGQASVKLSKAEAKLGAAAAMRSKSDPDVDPVTGAELGAGPGAGENAEEAKAELEKKL